MPSEMSCYGVVEGEIISLFREMLWPFLFPKRKEGASKLVKIICCSRGRRTGLFLPSEGILNVQEARPLQGSACGTAGQGGRKAPRCLLVSDLQVPRTESVFYGKELTFLH